MKSDFDRIHRGMNLIEALRMAKLHGCAVTNVDGTGEVRVSHPSWPRPIVTSARRKDAHRRLTSLLRRLMKSGAIVR